MFFRRKKEESKTAKRRSRNKYYTFQLIPHNSAKNIIKFRFPSYTVYILAFLFIGFIVFALSSTIYTASLTRRLIHYRATLQSNEEQKRQIDYFSKETAQVKKAIRELIDRDNELRRLLGLKTKESKISLSSIVTSAERRRFAYVDDSTGLKINRITADLDVADRNLEVRRESLEGLQETVAYLRKRFEHTPSHWPIYGRIVSGFGYRYRPWRGFHPGIDITGWYGAPIRATAAGVVVHAGWMGGYGRTIVIDHGYGFKTIYGHNSKLAVSIGSRVRKGQIIAYVGATGLATGPHVHYEVRKNNRPVNPVSYLNLNIFTAGKVWK